MPLMLNNPRTVECTFEHPHKIALWRIQSYNRPSAGTSVTPLADTDVLTTHDEPYSLVVWNDEVNTFEWVIETLIEVCGQSQEQAEQCAMIIHTKGKYSVKRGPYDELKP